MKVAVYAYDALYWGSQGIFIKAVADFNSIDEVENFAQSLSEELIQEFDCIMCQFEDDAAEHGFLEGTEEYQNFIWEAIQEDVAYEFFFITEKTNKTNEQLLNEYCTDEESFLETYLVNTHR